MSNTNKGSKVVSLANATAKGIASTSPAQLLELARQNMKNILEVADTMTTLKAAEAGDVLMVVGTDHAISMQMVLRREGFRGRDAGRTELDLQNMISGDLDQHVIRGNQLPDGMLAAFGVKVPRRAGKAAVAPTSTTRKVQAEASVTPAPVAAQTPAPVAEPVAEVVESPSVLIAGAGPVVVSGGSAQVVMQPVAQEQPAEEPTLPANSSIASLLLAGVDDSGTEDSDPDAEEDAALLAMREDEEARAADSEDDEDEDSEEDSDEDEDSDDEDSDDEDSDEDEDESDDE